LWSWSVQNLQKKKNQKKKSKRWANKDDILCFLLNTLCKYRRCWKKVFCYLIVKKKKNISIFKTLLCQIFSKITWKACLFYHSSTFVKCIEKSEKSKKKNISTVFPRNHLITYYRKKLMFSQFIVCIEKTQFLIETWTCSEVWLK
jgi:hypothetical protein